MTAEKRPGAQQLRTSYGAESLRANIRVRTTKMNDTLVSNKSAQPRELASATNQTISSIGGPSVFHLRKHSEKQPRYTRAANHSQVAAQSRGQAAEGSNIQVAQLISQSEFERELRERFMGSLARDKLNSSQVCGEYHGASRPDAEVQASEQLHVQRKAYTSKGGARPQRSNHANKGKAALESHYSINKGPKFGHDELQSALAKIGKKGAPPRLSGAETTGL